MTMLPARLARPAGWAHHPSRMIRPDGIDDAPNLGRQLRPFPERQKTPSWPAHPAAAARVVTLAGS
jgi:hypothetical protein